MKTELDSHQDKFTDLRSQMESLYSLAFDSVSSPDSEPAIIEEISNEEDRYVILSTIAEGGSKLILMIEDRVTGRALAMAVQKEESSTLGHEGFLREARITSILQHPNILPVYDMGINKDQQPYFTMKYVDGVNLREFLEQNKISLNDRVDIFYKVCEAIAYAHSCGVLHLDLKPENIQISSYGEVLVCDWGLAEILDYKCQDPHLERYSFDKTEQMQNLNGVIKGTPGYMAPEQVIQGQRKNQTTDIFTLGAILYEIIFRNPAIKGSIEECLNKTKSDPTACFGKNIPHDSLSAIAYKAMQLAPEQRYQCVDDLMIDLKSYRLGFVTSAEDAPLWRHLQLFYKRHRTKVNLSAIFLILVFITAVYSFISIKKSEKVAVTALHTIAIEQKERIRLGREAAPRIFKQANHFFTLGDFDKAKERAKTALVLDPERAEVRTLLGILFFLEKNYVRAAELLTETKTPLEKKIQNLNEFYKKGNYTPDEEREMVGELLRYCSRIIPSPLTIAISFHWINDDKDDLLQRRAMYWLAVSPEFSRRILSSVAQLNNESVREVILKKILLSLETNPEWLSRRIPATLGMKLTTDQEVKDRFKALIPDNLALGQPVTTNGGDESSASYAVDGERSGNWWAGNPFPAYITIDLGIETTVKEFDVYFYNRDLRYYQYLIQTSIDGVVYTTVVDQSNTKKLAKDSPFKHTINPTHARYVRLLVTHNSVNTSVHVREFEVY